MESEKLKEILKSQDIPTTQAFNIITDDLPQAVPIDQWNAHMDVIRYFQYKIEAVLIPVIQELRGKK